LEGQLGGGSTADSSSALIVETLTAGVTDVCAGEGHSVFVDTSGGVWTVGRNVEGQLGDGTFTTRLTVRCLILDPFIVASLYLEGLFTFPKPLSAGELSVLLEV
jgi:alpha-tubulin suppressor-like RCC1 family protein